MTPQDRADRNDRREEAAERADLMRRALANAAQKRADERARALAVKVKPTLPVIWNQSFLPSNATTGKTYPFRGKQKTVDEIASALGLTKRAVYLRLQRGIPVEEVLKRGPKPKPPKQKEPNAPRPERIRRTLTAEEVHARVTSTRLPKNINRRTDLSTVFSEG